MWLLNNTTPYAAERNWIRDKHGFHQWIVAIKATFCIAENGSLTLAGIQDPPLLAPEYFAKPGKSSLRYESDLGLLKPSTDITLLGSAHAPRGKAAESVLVSMQAGPVKKDLLVFGERVFQAGITGPVPSHPIPFIQKPLLYEFAYGGMDTSDPDPSRHGFDPRNPIGRGFALHSKALYQQPAPCIEYPNRDMQTAGPAGLGPIASYWEPRLSYGGSYGSAWEKSKKPLLPDDYDDRASLCAPADQQAPAYLRGGEPVILQNLSRAGLLRFTLPSISLALHTAIGAKAEQHPAYLVSVIIEPDDMRLRLVWQSSLMVPARDTEYLDQTTINEIGLNHAHV